MSSPNRSFTRDLKKASKTLRNDTAASQTAFMAALMQLPFKARFKVTMAILKGVKK